jgi:hypothetical protein
MEFRWVALITVWTLFVGPVFEAPFGSPGVSSTSGSCRHSAKTKIVRHIGR